MTYLSVAHIRHCVRQQAQQHGLTLWHMAAAEKWVSLSYLLSVPAGKPAPVLQVHMSVKASGDTCCEGPLGAVRLLDRPSWLTAEPETTAAESQLLASSADACLHDV